MCLHIIKNGEIKNSWNKDYKIQIMDNLKMQIEKIEAFKGLSLDSIKY